MKTMIWWVRRDLRLEDNPALQVGGEGGAKVLPVFILDPALLKQAGEIRKNFLFRALRALDERLRKQGTCLVVRRGNPTEELERLRMETGAQSIVAAEDYSPYARRRDAAVGAALDLKLVGGPTIHPPGALLKPDGTPYRVFTAFMKAWKSLPAPSPLQDTAPLDFLDGRELPGHSIPDVRDDGFLPADAEEAHCRLITFSSGQIFQYTGGRDRLGEEGTSVLSPYLRFGILSARQALQAAQKAARSAATPEERLGCETWINELVWREFYFSILYHFPGVLKEAFRAPYRGIRWRCSLQELEAWKAGLTGYPAVDAGMRQLLRCGWMHNRARMITASFLVKDLLLDWQEGERWFMQNLVDGDPAANNGGWQWCAGVGTDAAPYFRIFSPVSQSLKHDPRGIFVRQWVNELRNVPDAYIHTPWKMPLEVQRACGCVIGKDYPAPMVDHAAARQRTLQAYREIS